MAKIKNEESYLSSTDSKEIEDENTYEFMTAVKASTLIKKFPFNYIRTGFLKIMGYWLWIILVTVGLNAPLVYVYRGFSRFKTMLHVWWLLVSNTLFLMGFSALLLGKTRKTIKRPTYVQILTLIFVSLTYLPIYTLLYFFVQRGSDLARSNYLCVCALFPFVFIIKNINSVWKFTHHKFFFVVFYIFLYFLLIGNISIFGVILHGTDTELSNIISPQKFDK